MVVWLRRTRELLSAGILDEMLHYRAGAEVRAAGTQAVQESR
jgi:hypothetical protein